MAILTALIFAAVPVHAQSNSSEPKAATKKPRPGALLRNTVEAKTSLNVSDEVSVTYEEGNRGAAMREAMDIEFVNCTGNPTTGQVWVTLRVRVREGNSALVKLDDATTSDGKIFESGKPLPTEYPVVENQWTELVLDDYPLNVPTDIEGFETVRFVSIHGLQFRLHNVKITWVAPEQ